MDFLKLWISGKFWTG